MLLSLLFLKVQGAGVTTHLTYVARVTTERFDDYHPWLKAGAFFPDSLYSCKPGKELHKFAEATHWPPFLISGFNLWQENYGRIPSRRYSRDSLRLQAFLTGVFTHQIVDSSWHSLVDNYRSHGLLRVFAETEFYGKIDDAHNFLDTMGDFIGLSNVFNDVTDENWRYYVDGNWSLPREQDMMELLSRNGLKSGQITYKELGVCVSRGLSASISETYAMLSRRREILNLAYKITPASRDFMQEYWLGGEFDLIAMLQKCLPVYQELFDSNSQDRKSMELIQLCGNLPNTRGPNSGSFQASAVDSDRELTIVRPVTSRSNFGSSIALGRFKADNELYMAVGAPLESSEGHVYLIPFDEASRSSELEVLMEPFTPMRGTTVHKFRLNDKDFLAVSEPGTNSIFFYQDGKKLLTIHDHKTTDALQLHLYAVADVDGDLVPDLLLSGSSYGKNETGCVMIVPGMNLEKHLKSRIQSSISLDISSLSIVKLNGGPYTKPYQHFGSAIAASRDYSNKGFLYVTCQSLGAVFAYQLSDLHSLSLPKYILTDRGVLLPEEDLPIDLKVISSAVHGMFGKSMHSWTYRGNCYLAISQHLFNNVYIYREEDGFLKYVLKVRLEDDQEKQAWSLGFGTAVVYDDQSQILRISAPGCFGNKGAIWKVAMQELLDAAEFWKLEIFFVNMANNLDLINTQPEAKGFSNFGKVMEVGPNSSLIIGAPQYGYGNLHDNQLTGAIFVK